MRGSALVHTENNHEGIVAHNSGIIALLPVSERPVAVPETTYQSLLPPTTVPGLKDSTEDYLTLGYLHHRYRRESQHKGTNAARSLRNLACRRARQTDVTEQANMNCVVGQQYRTANSKTTVCGRPLQPREPTVRVERLEVELHRYGRIVPTSSGSYHILDTSTPESLSEGSVHPFSENRKVVHAYCSVDDVNVPVNRVGRKPNRVIGARDRAGGVYDATSDTNITEDNCDCASDLDGADVSSQINKTISRGYSKDNHFKNSTHEHGEWERDLTIYAGNSTSSSSDTGLKHVSTDRQYFQKDTEKCWQPIYEPISDADSEPDSIRGTMPSKTQVDDSVSMKHEYVHCDRPENSVDRSRHCSLADVRKDTAEGVNKRRYSAPDDPLRKNKKEDRKKKRQRRWSFNTQLDMLHTDHREAVKKLYLNRLLLAKDAKIKSWNVFIDIAHDDHSMEEFQFPEPPLSKNTVVKEEKEESASAVPEHNSSGIQHSARASSPNNKETMCGDFPCSEFNHELNIEDEDTVEVPRVFISVPVSGAYGSRNVLGELPISERQDVEHIPRSESNNSVIVSSAAILHETEGKYELPSEIQETQTPEAGIVSKSLTEKRKVESSVPAEAILPDDKRHCYPLKVTDPLEYYPCGIALCVKCEKGECVQHISCNSSESLKTHGCYNREARYQNTDVASKNTKDPREVFANVITDVSRNNEPGVRMRLSSQEYSSGMITNDTSKNAKYGHRTADSLLAKNEEVSDACSTYVNTEKSVHANSADCDRSSENWPRPVHRTNLSNSETDKEKLSRNFDSNPLTVTPTISPWQHVYGEESSGGKPASTSNLGPYGEPVNDLEEKENENCSNDSDKEVVICENTDQTDGKPDIDTHIDSKNPADVSKRSRGYRELTNGNKDSSPPRKAKTRRRRGRYTPRRKEHDTNKEASGDDSQIRTKQRAPRKPRHSRRSFRHDSIQMFKVSTAFPPQNVHVPWRYKRKKPELHDPVDPKIGSPPPPVKNPSHTKPRFDDAVTDIGIEDDIPSPGSLTIDLGEHNTNSSELCNEDDRSRRQNNIDGSDGEEDVVSPVRRRTSTEADSSGTKEKTNLGTSSNNDQDQNQIGDLVSESSDEGQSKKKRRRAKKGKIGDASATVNVNQNKLSAQMQEKGRRLAQELPRFNWLEEKIRNGGVTTVLPPKRVSGGSVVDPPNKSISASETTRNVVSHRVSNSASNAARTSVPPAPSSPPEQRNSKRLQEYLLRPPKRARASPTRVSEVGNERHEIIPALQPTHQHAEIPSAPLAVAPVSPLQRLHYPQQISPRHVQPPRTVPEREDSPAHNQSARRPVIVSVSELAKSSDVSPLLQQLTSGGELEVTLSAPSTSSSVSSDSGVVSLPSHRTSSDGEQPDVTHVNVKAMNAGNMKQYTEERPRDAAQHSPASYKRISYAVEQLSQPHQPEPSIFPSHEHIPVYTWNREAPRWQGDAPARRVQESSSGSADAAYSDRIATMARHAATSFDTGFGMGLAVPQEACQRVARHQQHRPPDSAHQPTTYHREHMLRPPGYLPPHVQHPGAGAYDFRATQYRLSQPSYVVPQQSLKPQIVRPSAQYPAGMGPCHPSHTCSQTYTAAASNSQVFIPRIPQHSSSLISSHPSMFSPHASRRKTDPSMSQTSSTVPSNHSSSVTETASEAPQTPSSVHSQAQTPGPQNEAHAAEPENRAVISDPLDKEQDPPKGIEEIRKAAEAYAEKLEELEQLKETAKKNLERLKLAEEQAMKELARSQKQSEEALGVHQAGKAVEPKAAVPVATAASSESSKPILYAAFPKAAQERHQPHVQDTQKSSQRPNNAADADGNSIIELHITLPTVTQENKQSAAAHENHHLGLGCKHHQSDITQNNLQSGGARWNKQSTFIHENHQFGAACRNQQSSDACRIQRSEAARENHPPEDACRHQQSAVAGENCQSGAVCKNKQLAGAHESNQLEKDGKSEDPAVAHDERHSGVTFKNLPTQQKCSVTSDSTATFPAAVQANQSTRDSCDTQQKQIVSADTTGSSVPVLNTTLETVIWEKESSGAANENSQAQHVPRCRSGSTDNSIPKFHTKIPTVKSENNLTQQKLTVSSNSNGNSVTQLNLTFQTVAHENRQSDILCRNLEIQRKLNVISDNTRSSVSAMKVTHPHPAALQLNNQSGVVRDHQQSDSVCRDHTRRELSATLDNRLTGNSVPVLNVTFSALAQENQQSGFACRNQQQRDACGQYQSAAPCECCRSVQRTSGTMGVNRSSLQGLHMAYPGVTCEKYQSEQKINVSVSSMTRNSAPGLLTTCPTTGYQNQEAVPRTLPSSAQLVRPLLPAPVSHQVTYSQSQPAPHPQGHSIVLHRQPIKVAHPSLQPLHSKFSSISHPSARPQLPHMPQPTLYSQLSPVSQTALKSKLLSVSQTSPHFQSSPVSRESPRSQSEVTSGTSPHFHTLPQSQTAPRYESISPHSQSLVITQKFPHSQALSLSHTSPNSQSLPVSQISPHSQSFPVPQKSAYVHPSLVSPHTQNSQLLQISHTSAHSHLSPVSQSSPQSQSLPFFQTSHSQPGAASHPPVDHQTLQVPQHLPPKTQPLQVPTDKLRSTTNLPHSSVEMLAVQSKTMPPPPRRQNILPKPPESGGSQISLPVLSKHTSPQTTPDPIVVHSVVSPTDVSVISEFRSVQQSSVITQEPHAGISSTSNRLHSSTVEECPIDLSIGKQKSEAEGKNKPSVSVTSVVLPLCQHNEQNNHGQHSTSPRHRQGSSEIQPSVVRKLSSEECNVTDNTGILHHNYRMPHSHTSQLQSVKNSGHQQQLQTSLQEGSKVRDPPSAASFSTVDNSTGKDELGRQHDGQGRQHDGHGRQHDGQGRQHDGQGRQHDGQGRQHDGQGRQLDGQGRQHDGQGRQHDGQRRQQDGQGRQHDSQGRQHNGQGRQQDGQGRQHDSQGRQHDSQGRQQDGQGRQHDGQGRQHDGQGRQHDGQGRQHDGQGRQHDGQGRQHDGQGRQHDGQGRQHDGQGRQNDGHRTSVPECSDRQKRFEILRDQNVDGGGVLHRRHVRIPEHHEMAHLSQHSVHQYHTHRLIPSSSHVPAYHKTVAHGLQSEQQQGNQTAELHTASAVSSRRDAYWSANKQVSSTAAVAPVRPPQDARSVAGEHSHTRSQLVCGRCKHTARFMCSACHNEWYCSSDCQLRHWSLHSVDCSRQHQNEDK